MTQTPVKLTFDEYLAYNDGTNTRYELVNGTLVIMPPAIHKHRRIAKFLERLFEQEIVKLGYNWETGRGDVGVRTQGIKGDTNRLPDVIVFTGDAISDPNSVAILEIPPLLVVEVVSSNWKDDYEQKMDEYEALGIPEYWIVDYACQAPAKYLGNPKLPSIFVHYLDHGKYKSDRFTGGEAIISPTFPKLSLTVDMIQFL